MNIYMDYYTTKSNGVLFKNNKKSMVTIDGVFKVDDNNNGNITFTPNSSYSEPIYLNLNHKLHPMQDKIDELYSNPENIELRDEIINNLTLNGGSTSEIINFLEICPSYYNYFKNIVFNSNNSENIYEWLHYYHKLKDDNSVDILIESLRNKDFIAIHQILLCDVMNNSASYNNADRIEKQLKMLALDLYEPEYFLNNFKILFNNCLIYHDENSKYTAVEVERHELVHNSIVNNFYYGLPKEYELGFRL